MRIGVIGINHKLANLELRELLAKTCQRIFIGGGVTNDQHTAILLSTCNRTEIYFSSDDLTETHSHFLQLLRNDIDEEFDQKVYSYFGHDCFLHLARVTAGLDSAIVGETEIQGQVKSAYENASACLQLPSELHFLFQKALKVGKTVRTELSLGRGMPDLEHAIFNVGANLFDPSIQQPKILFVGASEVNCKILSFLQSKKYSDITLCNRSSQRAQQIAGHYGLSLLDWSRIDQWHHYQWIVFGTKAPHHLVTQESIPNDCISKKLIIDISVPRNVKPRLAKDPRITLLNIDQINRMLKIRKQGMAQDLLHAETIISNSTQRYFFKFKERSPQSNVSSALIY